MLQSKFIYILKEEIFAYRVVEANDCQLQHSDTRRHTIVGAKFKDSLHVTLLTSF